MPSNYGQARVTIDSQTVGKVRLNAVTAEQALAPRLRFHFAWALSHIPENRYRSTSEAKEFRVIGVDGEVRLAEHGPVVGMMSRVGNRRHLRSLNHVDEQSDTLVLDLDWFRFQRLEEHRQGGSLDLWLQLWPYVEHNGGRLEATADGFRATVPREDWLNVVTATTGDHTDLLEVTYHLTYAAHFRPSVEEIQNGRQAIDRGDYMQAVVRARKALELLEKAVRTEGGKREGLSASLSDVVDKRHAKLYGTIAARIKDMGNIQVHDPQAREYSRMEALFGLRVAEAMLELVGSLVNRRSKTMPTQ